MVAAALTASTLSGTAAVAKPLDKGHFRDSGTDFYDCNGIPARDAFDVRGSFLLNERGSSPFPYYRESVRGTVVTTNLDTGKTFTQVFTNNSRDLSITDNGDGTITILASASGGSRFYDSDGAFVLKDPGMTGFAVTIDYGGTPTDIEDDETVGVEIVRPSTGNSDLSDVDFCDLLAEYTG